MRGGTETTYTGDGVNGVLGQRYKLHALLATSTLMVESFPADAVCDILVVGGGGASGVAGGGGGGVLASSIARFAVGEVPVVIGAGGLPVSGSDTVGDRQGFASSVGPYVAIGGGMGAGDNTILNGWPGASGGGSRGAPGLSTGGFTILASQGNNGGSSTVDSAGGGGGGAGGPVLPRPHRRAALAAQVSPRTSPGWQPCSAQAVEAAGRLRVVLRAAQAQARAAQQSAPRELLTRVVGRVAGTAPATASLEAAALPTFDTRSEEA